MVKKLIILTLLTLTSCDLPTAEEIQNHHNKGYADRFLPHNAENLQNLGNKNFVYEITIQDYRYLIMHQVGEESASGLTVLNKWKITAERE